MFAYQLTDMLSIKYCIFFIASFLCFITKAQDNQNTELAKLTTGSFPVYKAVENGSSFKFESTSKPWPLSFIKEGENFTEIIVNRSGIIEEKYQADLLGYPAYYKSAASEIVVSAIDKKIYYYSWSVKTGASIKYIFSDARIKNYADEKAILDNYRNSIKDLQANTRTQRINENNLIAEKLAEENTLKGKTIKNIKIIAIDKPTEIGLLSILAIGAEFELADGKILKTKNLGGHTPYTDFESEVSGGDFSGGDFKVADDSRKIPNDKIEISIWSKFDDKKLKTKFTCDVNYKKDINYNFSGNAGAWGRAYTQGYTINGSNGNDGKSVNISVTSMQINGEKVNKLVITEAYSGRIMAEAKLHTNNTININANGGVGGNGSEEKTGNGGSGGNGGNGGNISLAGNGVSSLKIAVSNSGGKGGIGGKAKTAAYFNGANGTAGTNGTLIK